MLYLKHFCNIFIHYKSPAVHISFLEDNTRMSDGEWGDVSSTSLRPENGFGSAGFYKPPPDFGGSVTHANSGFGKQVHFGFDKPANATKASASSGFIGFSQTGCSTNIDVAPSSGIGSGVTPNTDNFDGGVVSNNAFSLRGSSASHGFTLLTRSGFGTTPSGGGFSSSASSVSCVGFGSGDYSHRSSGQEKCSLFDSGDKRLKSCFNCGDDSHMRFDCPELRKRGMQTDSRLRSFSRGDFGSSFGGGVANARVGSGSGSNARGFTRDNNGVGREDFDKKAPSTYIPTDVDENILFAEKIEEGTRFENFFDCDVVIQIGKQTVSNPERIVSFDDMNFSEILSANVARCGYNKPTPVQTYAIPLIENKYDMMSCAQTGSGKTAAFLLPIIKSLLNDGDLSTQTEVVCSPRCIIVSPTRELAQQIFNEGRKFTLGTKISVQCLFGGTQVAYAKSRIALGANILVATLGRLLHFINEGIISLAMVKYVVLDEADRMLDQGFANDINKLFTAFDLPGKEDRQTLMFSATFPADVQDLALEHLKEHYALLAVDKIGGANKCITQDFIHVQDRAMKKLKLLELLKIDVEKSRVTDKQIFTQKTIVFVNRKAFADVLGIILSEAGLPCTTIHGDRFQNQRNEAINDFKAGRKPVMIATAVAERGLDISGVDHVINYDLPDNRCEYVHRIGRTGRLGNCGRATSFFEDSVDGGVAGELVHVLIEAEQIVPEFLQQYAACTIPV